MNNNYEQNYVKFLLSKKEYKKLCDYLTPFALQGNAQAQSQLAFCYYQGSGVIKSNKQAVRWWTKITENPSAKDDEKANAYYKLGLCYGRGEGVDKDLEKAFESMQNAADLNLPEALYAVACCYSNGEGVPEDDLASFEYYKKAAKAEYPPAYIELGKCYYSGQGGEKNPDEAFKYIQKGAKHRFPEALLMLGVCYYNGEGVTQNSKKAFGYFQEAAEFNVPEAFYNLAICYHFGEGIAKDSATAFNHLESAAKLNFSYAFFALSHCYYFGEGIDKNPKKAFDLCQEAAVLGVPDAIYSLAICYQKGDCVEKDLFVALKHFEKAYQKGIEKALINIGEIYIEQKKFGKAKEKFNEALKSASPEIVSYGKYGLGLLYLEGLGAERDFEKAVELFEESGKGGYSFAYSKLGLIYSSESISGEEKNLNTAARYFLKDKEFFDEQNMYLLMKESCERAWEWAEDETDEGNVSVSSHVALYYLLGIGTEKKCPKAIDILSADSHKDDVFSLLILGHCYATGLGGCDVDILQASELQRRAVDIDSEAAKEKQKELSKEIKYAQESQEEQIASLKKERDELQNKLKEKEKENSLNTAYLLAEMKKSLLSLEQQGKHNGKKLDEISGKMDSLTSLVTEFKNENSSLVEKIESLQTQVDSSAQAVGKKIFELFETESKLSGEMEKLTQGETEKAANRVECKEILSSLKALFGEWWDKLDEYTQNALVTGQYLFNALEKSSLDNCDYSGVCVTVCSALEHHLKQILFFGLQNYLENKKIEVTEWPKLLVSKDEKGSVKKDTGNHFTLGSIPYYIGTKNVIGRYGKYSANDYEKLASLFEEYARYATGFSDFTCKKDMKDIIDRIETVRKNYRNPAAHTSSVNSALASDCLETIVGRNEALQKTETVKGLILEITVLFSNYKSVTE